MESGNLRDISPSPAKRYASILKKHKKNFSFGKPQEEKNPNRSLSPLHRAALEMEIRRSSLEPPTQKLTST